MGTRPTFRAFRRLLTAEDIISERPLVAPYFVKVERAGVSPHREQLLVRATSRGKAAELASFIAESRRGGMFVAKSVRRAPGDELDYPVRAFDDSGY